MVSTGTYPDNRHGWHGRGPSAVYDGRWSPVAERRRPLQTSPGRAAGRLGTQRPVRALPDRSRRPDDGRRRGRGPPRRRRVPELVFRDAFLLQDGLGRWLVVRPIVVSVERHRCGCPAGQQKPKWRVWVTHAIFIEIKTSRGWCIAQVFIFLISVH